jgi:hypothetical protein
MQLLLRGSSWKAANHRNVGPVRPEPLACGPRIGRTAQSPQIRFPVTSGPSVRYLQIQRDSPRTRTSLSPHLFLWGHE